MKGILRVLATCIFIFVAQPSTQLRATAEWTVLVYIQASNNLESFAQTNLRDMMRIGSNDKVNIMVEIHRPGDKAWRYKIEKNQLVTHEVISRTGTPNTSKELISSMRWAVEAAPAEKHALILWNHGTGPIDPVWNGVQPYYMKQGMIEQNPRLQIGGITSSFASIFGRIQGNRLAAERGILFDDERHTYLTNEAMRKTFQIIKDDVLGGKKIDLLGMDACFMGMIEIGYQVKDFAEYFVASQEFEFAYGWPYAPFLRRLAQGNTSAKELGAKIVESYNEFYKPKTKMYTLSCVDLSLMDQLAHNTTKVSQAIITLKDQDKRKVRSIVSKSRSQCLQFSTQHYIDMYSFYQELHRNISKKQNPAHSAYQTLNINANPQDIETLKKLLLDGMQLIKKIVTHNIAGMHLANASGVSIYFPTGHIDQSYTTTEFCKNTGWVDFVYDHLANK